MTHDWLLILKALGKLRLRHMKLLAQDLRRDYWREFRKIAFGLTSSCADE
jgi:hypothetical protein